MVEPWYMELPFNRLRGQLSREDFNKLKRFYTQQLALCQALQDGKPLGICRITTSEGKAYQNTLAEVNSIFQSEDSREMSS